MEPVILVTDRLRLSATSAGDAQEVYAACQDPAVQRWIPAMPSPYGMEHAREFVERTVPEGWRTDTAYNFAVRPRHGGPLLAAAGLHSPRGGTSWEVGYWAAPDQRGHGYVTEAVLAVARWAFTDLACSRLEWRAEVGNTASRAVVERAGFTLEGVLRAGMRGRGTVRDAWAASLLPSDLGLPSALPYLPARSDAPGR
ncbi:GNAT family N-acetyltransferase [Streptomyces sp. NPDC001941]|uniref:GNAT family N-acetyltransferase n=1 Tax=Streptomyces sp. NPDC001941 TaxID=3154659 RepID=UPI00333281F3